MQRLLCACLSIAISVGCAGSRDLSAVQDGPGFSHIHGLGVNPSDGSLYAATHGGLYRLADGRAKIIANRHQDTMGFTVAGDDHFFASGHPDLREELPPLLGLLESTDAGVTWDTKSLTGKADFHALRYAHDRIYGYDSTGRRFLVSRDGKRWDDRSKTTLRDFVVSPDSGDIVIATTPIGLERSADGGRTWKELSGPRQPVLLDWPETDELWTVLYDGSVHVSEDGGKTWEKRGKVAPQPQAFLVDGKNSYVAFHDVIYRSRNGGRDWKRFFEEGERG